MKTILYLLISLFFSVLVSGCNTKEEARYFTEHRCLTSEDREKLAEFIVECTRENADYVHKCRYVGEQIFCPEHTFKVVRTNGVVRNELVDPTDPQPP